MLLNMAIYEKHTDYLQVLIDLIDILFIWYFSEHCLKNLDVHICCNSNAVWLQHCRQILSTFSTIGWNNFHIRILIKVHIFWEGHKNLKKIFTLLLSNLKTIGDFFKLYVLLTISKLNHFCRNIFERFISQMQNDAKFL